MPSSGRQGFEISGIDRSEEMLSVARRKAAAADLAIPFRCQDLRDRWPAPPVDAVVCFFGGLNFLTTRTALRRGFAAAYETLAPGGLFLFDQFTEDRMRQLFSGKRRASCGIWTVEISSRCAADGRIRHRVVFDERGEGGRREAEVHHLRIHRSDEIDTLLAEIGFEPLHREEIGRAVGSALLADDYVFVHRRAMQAVRPAADFRARPR